MSFYQKTNKVVVVLGLLGSITVLCGWAFNVNMFREIIPNELDVMPNTAIGLFFCCIALMLLSLPDNRAVRVLLFATSAIVFLLGSITMVEFFSGRNLGIDEIFSPLIHPALAALSKRMSPGTTLCLAISGPAFALISSERRWLQNAGQILLHVVTLVSVLAMLGYLYRVPALFHATSMTPMPVRASFSFLVVSIAASLRHPQLGLTGLLSGPNLGSIMARRLFPPTLLAILLIGYMRLISSRFNLIPEQFGISLVFVSILLVSLFLIWNTASQLNKIDLQRMAAREEVENLNKNLEQKIYERTLTLNYTIDALKTSEEKFRLLVESARDYAIFLIDTGGIIQTWSAGAQAVHGYTTEEALGKHISIFYTPDERNRNEPFSDIGDAAKEGRYECEGLRKRKDGSEFWADIVFTALYDNNGNTTGFVNVTRDITVRKQTAERLELALDGMVAGFWDWDILADTRWWSPRYFNLLGYEFNEIGTSDKVLSELLHPDDRKLAFSTISALLHKKDRSEIEIRYKTKSGIYKWFQITAQAKFDENGLAVRMVGSIIDINEKKKHLETIDSQASLIQMMPDAIIYALENNTFVNINKGAEIMLEIPAQQIKGKNIDDVMRSRILTTTRELARQELKEKGFWRGEVEVTTNTGKNLRLLTNIKAVKDVDGKGAGWVAIYSDISLLHINEELKVAMEKLEANNEYLEQLAYISAHDIKSPILTLKGLIDVLEKSNAVKPEYMEMLTMLTGTIHQMQRTNHALNNILKLRKKLMNRELADDQAYELGTIIEDVKTTLRPDIEAAGAVLELNLDSISGVVFPYVHLQSVFYNLISNALKYRKANQTLIISIEARQFDNDMFEFCIEDNGIGFDVEKNQDKLFGIFKRFHDHVEGSGVGLHIVKSIVEAHGGTISAQSEPGKGSRFTITWNNLMFA